MEKNRQEENVEGKIDRLNNVITDLMKGFEESHLDMDKISLISSIGSYSTSFIDSFNQFSEISFDGFNLPQEVLDKFQENLTEIDRLKMKIEDILSNSLRHDDPFFEILISKDQILSLNDDIHNLIEENSENALIKIGKKLFFIEAANKPDKIIYYSQHIQKTSENSQKGLKENFEISNSISHSPIKPKNLFSLHAEFELKMLDLKKKEENLRRSEEELGYKTQQFELMKNDFFSKVAQGKKNNFSTQKLINKSSRDNPNDKTLNYFAKKNSQTVHGFYKTISIIEDLGNKSSSKVSPFKTSKNENPTTPLSQKFLTKKLEFSESVPKISNKEPYILKYLSEQNALLEAKMIELQNYEDYLYQTWIENFGENKAVAIVHNKTQKNFQLETEINKKIGVVDEKMRKLYKIVEVTKAENNRLEFHRKKIMSERQTLSKQQAELENAYDKLLKMTHNHCT